MGDSAGFRPEKVLVGLGNPGPRYAGTRHNFGFEVVERIGTAVGARFESRLDRSLVAEGMLEGRSVLLAKPLTYMNRSGSAVKELLVLTGVAVTDVLVFYDDIALPLGTIRIRERGGSGGHLGLESILEVLGREDLPRVRLGIRPPDPEDEPADLAAFVLEPFSRRERAVVAQVLDRAVSATRTILREGTARAMSLYNAAPV